MTGTNSLEFTLFRDASSPLEDRVEDLLSRLTFDEKVALTHADSKFTSPGVKRLGIGPLWLSDGPHGVREEISQDSWASAGRSDDYASYLPVLSVLAATWNLSLAREHGDVLAEEALARGKHVMLGPGINIMRTPLNGRNFEYFSEDPYFTSRMAVAYIGAMQSKGVAACAKHFAVNNQEWNRTKLNVEVSERALREIYLPAFESAVKESGVWTVMGAYNLLDGQHCCHHERLVNEILKEEWGFDGVYLSDWDGAVDGAEAALCGLDLEMGTAVESFDDFFLGDEFASGLRDCRYEMDTLDDKVRRNLRLMFRAGVVDGADSGILNGDVHQKAARRIAEEGIVLLRNEHGFLPFDEKSLNRIAVIGDAAVHGMAAEGGSSGVKCLYERSGLDGLLARLDGSSDLYYSAGYVVPDRISGGEPDEAGVIRGGEMRGGKTDPDELIERAVETARISEIAIVFVTNSHVDHQDAEGSDRVDMRLPWRQDELVERVCSANPNTIVVLYCGSPVEMPWVDQVKAILWAGYPGMEGGSALASILLGDVCPSGKMTYTLPKNLGDSAAHRGFDPLRYPGVRVEGEERYETRYEEGLLVGYRWHDTKMIEPLFEFGFGLSYAEFQYDEAKLLWNGEQAVVECDISNVGRYSGAEAVQVYVADVESSFERPDQELKGFAKVQLAVGERKRVRIPLDRRAFAFYDDREKCWREEAGLFAIRIGSSSRDVRLELSVDRGAAVVY